MAEIEFVSFRTPSNGLMEKRGGALIDIDKTALIKRMKEYYDKELDWGSYAAKRRGLERDRAGIDPSTVRDRAQREESFRYDRIVTYALRPFDTVLAYYSSVPGIWNRARPTYFEQCWSGNQSLVTRPVGVANPEGAPIYFTAAIGDNDLQRGHSYYYPFCLRVQPKKRIKDNGTSEMFGTGTAAPKTTANLSETARVYLSELGVKKPDKDIETAGIIWMHALAIGYSPAYLSENADGIRQDWPRIPLPKTKKALLASAKLGHQVAALLNTENDVPGVTAGKVNAILRTIAVPTHVAGAQLDPAKGDWDVTAGWGHGGQGAACMPGQGKTNSRKASHPKGGELLGNTTLDVYLNDAAYWCNIPQAVWDFHIGGYQVIKKWLSYREKTMLGRGLKLDEIEYVTNMARRIAALVLMQTELDRNYEQVKSATWSWVE